MAKDPKTQERESPLPAPIRPFSDEHIPTEQLMEEQGISEPQGLDAVSRPWPFTEVDGY
jgi:hypothetical protein